MIIWFIGVGIVLLMALIFITYYSKLVRLTNSIDSSISLVNAQIRRRAALAPTLLSNVGGYVKNERKLGEEVTSARLALLDAPNMSARLRAGAQLHMAIRTVLSSAESYPTLQNNERFRQLRSELLEIDKIVSNTRKSYNDSIMVYNVMMHSSPAKWFAKLYGFGKREFLKIPAEDSLGEKK